MNQGKQIWTFELTDLPKSEKVVQSEFRGKNENNIILKLLKQNSRKKVSSVSVNKPVKLYHVWLRIIIKK